MLDLFSFFFALFLSGFRFVSRAALSGFGWYRARLPWSERTGARRMGSNPIESRKFFFQNSRG